MNESDWRRLLQSLNNGKLILFLGPDITTTASGTSLLNAMAQRLAKEIGLSDELAKELNPGQICLRYEQHEDNDHFDLVDQVSDFYQDHADSQTKNLDLIASLPFNFCISSSPDTGLQQAMQKQGKQPVNDFYHYKKTRELAFHDPSPDKPLLYQLYGSLSDPESLILTDDDMLNFLVTIIKGTPALPAFLRSRLLDKESSLLFVGFGFRNWHVRILLHLLKENRQNSRSLAIEADDFYADPHYKSTLFYFKAAHKIRIHQLSWQDFLEQLVQRYKAMEPSKEAKIWENKPRLFLCHSNRDQDRVMAIAEKIQAQGLNIWIDKQDLRGGDDWYQLLIHVISRQADYVVVMQSADMHNRPESFFHKEVSIALERQSHFAAGAKFIIPALIDNCQPLTALQPWQQIDLTQEQGLAELISVVEEDWVMRKKAEQQREGVTHG